jgi:cell division protein FtsI/penicillin-binding protein 2
MGGTEHRSCPTPLQPGGPGALSPRLHVEAHATAAIALDLGVVHPDATMPISCTGRDAVSVIATGGAGGRRATGAWTWRGLIRHSCNVYFYQLGHPGGPSTGCWRRGRSHRFRPTVRGGPPGGGQGRFSRRRGLLGEQAFGLRATEAEVLSLAIGQGPNEPDSTEDGSALPGHRPGRHRRLLHGSSRPTIRPPGDGVSTSPKRHSRRLREGFRGVLRPGGTAHLSSLEHWDFMGKTGTSQNPPHP